MLVATDVVGRGIDVTSISHIINYDIPQFCDDYVHRVGRTGRMGREGVAYTFVTPEEGNELTRIEMRINRLLKRDEVPGFEAVREPDRQRRPTGCATEHVTDGAAAEEAAPAEPPKPARRTGPRRPPAEAIPPGVVTLVAEALPTKLMRLKDAARSILAANRMSNFNESSRDLAARGSREPRRLAMNDSALRGSAGASPSRLCCGPLAAGPLVRVLASSRAARPIRPRRRSRHPPAHFQAPHAADRPAAGRGSRCACPGYFDQAFPQWCEYFGVDPAKHADWHVRACLMRCASGSPRRVCCPRACPSFAPAMHLGDAVWLPRSDEPLLSPPPAAARRHARVHALARSAAVGPAWYAEGMAELLATHRWRTAS